MGKTQKNTLRLLSSLLVITFLIQEVSYAAPSLDTTNSFVSPLQVISMDPTCFEAPLDYVTMKEVHGAKGPFIIHIQDAHSNLSGQQNLAGALDEIMARYKVSLVLSEGGANDCSLTPIKKIAPPTVWKKIAKSYLMQGEISGSEYLNLTSDHAMKIIGIEDMALYVQSVDNYGKLADKREQVLEYLKTIQRSLDKLKQKFYPQELLEYEKNRKAGENFESNVKGLVRLIKDKNIPLDEFPNFKKLTDLETKESQINFDSANLEMGALVEEIAKRGGEEDLKSHLEKMGRLKNLKISQLAYFQNTLNIANQKNIDINKFTNLLLYIDYLKAFSDLDLDQLLDEIKKVEDSVYYSALQESEDARLVRAIDRYLSLLQTAYRIQMTTKEFKLFEANEPDFSTVSYLAFINRKLVEAGYFEDLISYLSLFEEGKKALEDFYDSVNQRDLAFIENTQRILDEEKQTVAVMITGGYHTAHLKSLFKEKGYSYAVLTPVITSETNQAKYEKLLLGPIRSEIKKIENVQGQAKADESSLSQLEQEFAQYKKRSDGVMTAMLRLHEDPSSASQRLNGPLLASAKSLYSSRQKTFDRLLRQTAKEVTSNDIEAQFLINTARAAIGLAEEEAPTAIAVARIAGARTAVKDGLFQEILSTAITNLFSALQWMFPKTDPVTLRRFEQLYGSTDIFNQKNFPELPIFHFYPTKHEVYRGLAEGYLRLTDEGRLVARHRFIDFSKAYNGWRKEDQKRLGRLFSSQIFDLPLADAVAGMPLPNIKEAISDIQYGYLYLNNDGLLQISHGDVKQYQDRLGQARESIAQDFRAVFPSETGLIRFKGAVDDLPLPTYERVQEDIRRGRMIFVSFNVELVGLLPVQYQSSLFAKGQMGGAIRSDQDNRRDLELAVQEKGFVRIENEMVQALAQGVGIPVQEELPTLYASPTPVFYKDAIVSHMPIFFRVFDDAIRQWLDTRQFPRMLAVGYVAHYDENSYSDDLRVFPYKLLRNVLHELLHFHPFAEWKNDQWREFFSLYADLMKIDSELKTFAEENKIPSSAKEIDAFLASSNSEAWVNASEAFTVVMSDFLTGLGGSRAYQKMRPRLQTFAESIGLRPLSPEQALVLEVGIQASISNQAPVSTARQVEGGVGSRKANLPEVGRALIEEVKRVRQLDAGHEGFVVHQIGGLPIFYVDAPYRVMGALFNRLNLALEWDPTGKKFKTTPNKVYREEEIGLWLTAKKNQKIKAGELTEADEYHGAFGVDYKLEKIVGEFLNKALDDGLSFEDLNEYERALVLFFIDQGWISQDANGRWVVKDEFKDYAIIGVPRDLKDQPGKDEEFDDETVFHEFGHAADFTSPMMSGSNVHAIIVSWWKTLGEREGPGNVQFGDRTIPLQQALFEMLKDMDYEIGDEIIGDDQDQGVALKYTELVAYLINPSSMLADIDRFGISTEEKPYFNIIGDLVNDDQSPLMAIHRELVAALETYNIGELTERYRFRPAGSRGAAVESTRVQEIADVFSLISERALQNWVLEGSQEQREQIDNLRLLAETIQTVLRSPRIFSGTIRQILELATELDSFIFSEHEMQQIRSAMEVVSDDIDWREVRFLYVAKNLEMAGLIPISGKVETAREASDGSDILSSEIPSEEGLTRWYPGGINWIDFSRVHPITLPPLGQWFRERWGGSLFRRGATEDEGSVGSRTPTEAIANAFALISWRAHQATSLETPPGQISQAEFLDGIATHLQAAVEDKNIDGVREAVAGVLASIEILESMDIASVLTPDEITQLRQAQVILQNAQSADVNWSEVRVLNSIFNSGHAEFGIRPDRDLPFLTFAEKSAVMNTHWSEADRTVFNDALREMIALIESTPEIGTGWGTNFKTDLNAALKKGEDFRIAWVSFEIQTPLTLTERFRYRLRQARDRVADSYLGRLFGLKPRQTEVIEITATPVVVSEDAPEPLIRVGDRDTTNVAEVGKIATEVEGAHKKDDKESVGARKAVEEASEEQPVRFLSSVGARFAERVTQEQIRSVGIDTSTETVLAAAILKDALSVDKPIQINLKDGDKVVGLELSTRVVSRDEKTGQITKAEVLFGFSELGIEPIPVPIDEAAFVAARALQASPAALTTEALVSDIGKSSVTEAVALMLRDLKQSIKGADEALQAQGAGPMDLSRQTVIVKVFSEAEWKNMSPATKLMIRLGAQFVQSAFKKDQVLFTAAIYQVDDGKVVLKLNPDAGQPGALFETDERLTNVLQNPPQGTKVMFQGDLPQQFLEQLAELNKTKTDLETYPAFGAVVTVSSIGDGERSQRIIPYGRADVLTLLTGASNVLTENVANYARGYLGMSVDATFIPLARDVSTETTLEGFKAANFVIEKMLDLAIEQAAVVARMMQKAVGAMA